MSYYGDIALGATLDVKFTTRQFSTGAPFALAGTPAVAAYVDNGTTEITAGITLTNNFDSRTGLHNVRVVASSGNGFAAGTNVQLVLTAGTVDGVSVVGEVVGSFSIEARSALRPTTAGRTLDVSAGGEAGVDWANVGSPSTAVNLSATNIDPDQVVASVTGAVGSVTGNVGGTVNGLTATAQGNVRTAVGLASADLDTQITGIPDAVHDEVVEGSRTLRQYLRGFAAALLGKSSGLETSEATYRDTGDTKDRIVATVDADGNRSDVTLDLS